MAACDGGNLDVIKYLCESGADVNILSKPQVIAFLLTDCSFVKFLSVTVDEAVDAETVGAQCCDREWPHTYCRLFALPHCEACAQRCEHKPFLYAIHVISHTDGHILCR